ncbi:MAG: Clp protease N-terminal domain-containing protein [Umezawaea sp.]
MTTSPHRLVVAAAFDEARGRGDRRVGTEHLLLGLLRDPDAAEAFGVDLATARAALEESDREALGALGIHLGAVDHVTPPKHPSIPASALTSAARAVLARGAARTTLTIGSAGPTRLAVALLDRPRPDPAAELLLRLGVDRTAVRTRLEAGRRSL